MLLLWGDLSLAFSSFVTAGDRHPRRATIYPAAGNAVASDIFVPLLGHTGSEQMPQTHYQSHRSAGSLADGPCARCRLRCKRSSGRVCFLAAPPSDSSADPPSRYPCLPGPVLMTTVDYFGSLPITPRGVACACRFPLTVSAIVRTWLLPLPSNYDPRDCQRPRQF